MLLCLWGGLVAEERQGMAPAATLSASPAVAEGPTRQWWAKAEGQAGARHWDFHVGCPQPQGGGNMARRLTRSFMILCRSLCSIAAQPHHYVPS